MNGLDSAPQHERKLSGIEFLLSMPDVSMLDEVHPKSTMFLDATEKS